MDEKMQTTQYKHNNAYNGTIRLQPRTAEHVRIYWERTQDDEIRSMFPMAGASLEQALELFEQSNLPGASSYGRIICADGHYIGDIWCYCIDEKEEKTAMLSILIFDKAFWHKGIGQRAIGLFLQEMFTKYQLETIGAFTFADNVSSVHALEKSGFEKLEEFSEDGRASVYLEYRPNKLR